MNFIEEMKEKARKDLKTIVLPEATDVRVLTATETATKEGYANVVLVGNVETVQNIAK